MIGRPDLGQPGLEGRLRGRVGQADLRDPVPGGLLGQPGRIAAPGRQPHRGEPVGRVLDHLERLGPDGSGGAEQYDGAGIGHGRHSGRPVPAPGEPVRTAPGGDARMRSDGIGPGAGQAEVNVAGVIR